jgi:hypothetical protein
MVIFYVYMRERAKKSPFYVAYTQIGNLRIGNLRIGNLRMRRKKLPKPSYAYMRSIRYGAKEITALCPVEYGRRYKFNPYCTL